MALHFPTDPEDELPIGAPCKTSPGLDGTCKLFSDCPQLLSGNEDAVFCSTSIGDLTVCCPNEVVSVFPGIVNVSAPYPYYTPIGAGPPCGTTGDLPTHSARLNGEYSKIYELNDTVVKLQSEGFQISNVHLYGDAVFNFTYSNETFEGSIGYEGTAAVLPAGGEPAKKQRAYFMALIGQRSSSGIKWVCDGVVLTRFWILSAAHCFIEPGIEPNVVRLGDYNWDSIDTTDEFYGEFVPVDFTIAKLELHPEFKVNERYHDLILIKLSRGFPMFSTNIAPVCLPWGEEVNRQHVGEELTLSGWGAIQFGGAKTPILQQVNLTVFDTSFCDRSYSSLFDYRRKWPQGMTPDRILCVGSLEGGKDACKGDSGAPVVYGETFTLAGIVSGGFGCGLADYPGLYIPINNPHYLSWIKRIAFSEYDEASNYNERGEKFQ